MEKVFSQIKTWKGTETGIRILMTLLLFGCLCSTFRQFRIPDFSFAVYPLTCTVAITAGIACLLVFLLKKTGRLHIGRPDYILLSIAVYYIIRYDFDEQLGNWRIALWGTVLIIWILIRWLLSNRMISTENIAWTVVAAGVLQAVWGLLQLYGFCPSNHERYDMTGTFMNPGPFAGYVGLAFPVALHLFLRYRDYKYWLALGAMLLMFCILPAGMSRSAWIGVAAASAWVVCSEKGLFTHWHTKRRAFISLLLSILIIGVTAGVFMFNLKKDSAYGRLFIWENVCSAIAKSPLTGYGSCSFPTVYAAAQSERFESGNYSDREERVAGNPEYAFNEYLQMWLEGGFILLFLFIAFIMTCMKQGWQQKHYGLCGGIISFLFFAFSSYPLQYPAFWVILCFLSAGITNSAPYGNGKRIFCILLPVLLCVSSVVIFKTLPSPQKQIETWEKCRVLRPMGEKQLAIEGYGMLFQSLKHNPRFISEYAQCMFEVADYEKSNLLYERYLKLQCNSLIYNFMGQNYQYMGQYREAESYYTKSINFLPNRIYPYYLLAKLDASESCRDSARFEAMKQVVLTKEPKVMSTAIREMREEIKKINWNRSVE